MLAVRSSENQLKRDRTVHYSFLWDCGAKAFTLHSTFSKKKLIISQWINWCGLRYIPEVIRINLNQPPSLNKEWIFNKLHKEFVVWRPWRTVKDCLCTKHKNFSITALDSLFDARVIDCQTEKSSNRQYIASHFAKAWYCREALFRDAMILEISLLAPFRGWSKVRVMGFAWPIGVLVCPTSVMQPQYTCLLLIGIQFWRALTHSSRPVRMKLLSTSTLRSTSHSHSLRIQTSTYRWKLRKNLPVVCRSKNALWGCIDALFWICKRFARQKLPNRTTSRLSKHQNRRTS